MPFYFENLAYFVPSTETKKINGFAPIHPRMLNALFSNSIFIIFQNPQTREQNWSHALNTPLFLLRAQNYPKGGI